jgi:hypothetical protein
MAGYPPMPPMPPVKRRRKRRVVQDEPGHRNSEPVFVEHEPVINHPPEAWHHHVPYPYRFKIDGGWLFIIALAAGGVVFKPLLFLAGFIAALRILVWLCYRFPLSTWFLVSFINGLFGRGRRW